MTAGFDAPVLVALDPGGTSVRVAEERVYTGSQGDRWVLPKGFSSDFATVPAVFSWAVPKLGAYTDAALVHDLFCVGLDDWHEAIEAWLWARARPVWNEDRSRVTHLVVEDGRVVARPTASSVDADAIFYRIARDHGTDPVIGSLLWLGVRYGALGSSARREGWMQTFWPVVGLSLLYAPVVLPATVLAVAGRVVLRLLSTVNRALTRKKP